MIYTKEFFDRGIDRRGTSCVKWDDRQEMNENDIPLWVADMDFACADEIRDALSKRALHACYGYTMPEQDDAQVLCDFLGRRHGLSVTPDQLSMLPCVITGLKALVRVFTDPGDPVAILTPVYGPFTSSIECNGRVPVRIELRRAEDGRYQIDFDQLEQAFRSGVKLLLMCSPHNPVSRVWTRDEMEKILHLCREYQVTLGADEIHAEFVLKPHRFTSFLALADEDDRVVSLMSASKTFNIAGLQQAVMISKNKAALKSLSDHLIAAGALSGNLFALTGTRAAYLYGDAWLDGLLGYLQENARVVAEETARLMPGAILTPIEATYLAWLDLRAYAKESKELARRARRAGVVLTPGTFFGPEGEGFMRVNFGCPVRQLKEGIARLAAAMK